MIIDGILNIFASLFNLLLSPLELVNVIIDVASSIPIFTGFLQVSMYLLPISNLIPLFVIVFSLISFKITISVIKTLWSLLPF